MHKSWINSLKNIPSKKILDFACGIGFLDIELAKLGYDVVGVDLSKEMLEEAKENSRKNNVKIKFLLADPRNSKIGKFDAILCTYNYIGHFSKRDFEKMLENWRENLKNEGFILFDIFNFKFMLKNFISSKFIDMARTFGNISVVRFNKNNLDKKRKLMKINQETFIEVDFKLKKFRDKWDLKIYDKEELEKFLEKHNFKILKLFGSIFCSHFIRKTYSYVNQK